MAKSEGSESVLCPSPQANHPPVIPPRDIVLRLNAEVNKALASPAVSESLAAAGTAIAGGTPEQFAEHLRRETEKWAKVIKKRSFGTHP